MLSDSLDGKEFIANSPIRFSLEFTRKEEKRSSNNLTLTSAIVQIKFWPNDNTRGTNAAPLYTMSTALSGTAQLVPDISTPAKFEVNGMVTGSNNAAWLGLIFYRLFITPTTGVAIGQTFLLGDGSFTMKR